MACAITAPESKIINKATNLQPFNITESLPWALYSYLAKAMGKDALRLSQIFFLPDLEK